MTCTTKMGMAEPYNGRILILVTRTVFVGPCLILPVDIMWNGIRIWTELNTAKGNTGTRKGMTHSIRSDNRIYILRLSEHRQ